MSCLPYGRFLPGMILALLGPSGVGAQVIAGRVEASDGASVTGAMVVIVGWDGTGVPLETTVDAMGGFTVLVPGAGRYIATARLDGWLAASDTVDVPARDSLVLLLTREPIALDSITVEGEARNARLSNSGFYRRRTVEQGTFVDRIMIEERRSRTLAELLRGVAGAQVVRLDDGRAGGDAQVVVFRTGCVPKVLWDGNVVIPGGLVDGARARGTMEPRRRDTLAGLQRYSIDDVAGIEDVEAIEIYRGPAQVPAEFTGSDAQCGVIVLWSRR